LRRNHMKEMEDVLQMLPYLVPLIALGIILLTVALIDLVKRKHVTGGNKVIWVLIIFIQIIGPVIYLIAGRKEEFSDSD
jgi:hypothetical protein